MDMRGAGINDIFAEFESHWLGNEVEGEKYLPAEAAFFRDVVSGVVRDQAKLDPMIDEALSKGWPLKRIDAILRAVLRAAPMNWSTARTCRPASSCRNMSTSRTPSSKARRPAWSTRCSIRSPPVPRRRVRGAVRVMRAASATRHPSYGAGTGSPGQAGDDGERPTCKRLRRRLADRALFQAAGDRPRRVRSRSTTPRSLKPSGDDIVVTTDAIVEGVHFSADDPPDTVARKALRVNLSDLAAKGATPAGFVLTLALRRR